MTTKTEKPKSFITKTEKPIQKIAKTENPNAPLPFAFQFKQADAPAVNVISLIPHMGYRFLNVTRQHSATHLLCTMISDDLELVQKASFHVAWVAAGPRTRLNPLYTVNSPQDGHL